MSKRNFKKANVRYSLFQVEDNHPVSEVILILEPTDSRSVTLYSLPFISSYLADNISIIICSLFLHPCVSVWLSSAPHSHVLTWKATRLHWVLPVFFSCHFSSPFFLQVSWMHFLFLKAFNFSTNITHFFPKMKN